MKIKFTLAIFLMLSKVSLHAQCWQQFSSGSGITSFGIKTDGTLWAWGNNSVGQLGIGTTFDKYIPVQIGFDNDWKYISAGNAHTLAIKNDGSLWAWGDNWYGQIGDESSEKMQLIPMHIGTDTDWAEIAVGDEHTIALKNDGSLWAWGQNNNGQLGDSTFINQNRPTRVGNSLDWFHIYAGGFSSFAIKKDGSLYGWGQNYSFQLGDLSILDRNTPRKIGSSTNWKKISSGHTHTLAIKTDGTLWAWGTSANWDSLGISKTPRLVEFGTGWQNISLGSQSFFGIKNDGTLWACGRNKYGNLGDGTNINRLNPVKIGANNNWKEISFFMASQSNQTLWTWGVNDYGQIGDGTNIDKNIPTQIHCNSTNETMDSRITVYDFQLYPNPSSENISIQFAESESENLSYTISNILGEVIISTKYLDATEGIDVSYLNSGIYILTISNVNGYFSKQFVKL